MCGRPYKRCARLPAMRAARDCEAKSQPQEEVRLPGETGVPNKASLHRRRLVRPDPLLVTSLAACISGTSRPRAFLNSCVSLHTGDAQLNGVDAIASQDPSCPDRSERDDGPRDLSPDPQGFRSSGPASIRARRVLLAAHDNGVIPSSPNADRKFPVRTASRRLAFVLLFCVTVSAIIAIMRNGNQPCSSHVRQRRKLASSTGWRETSRRTIELAASGEEET